MGAVLHLEVGGDPLPQPVADWFEEQHRAGQRAIRECGWWDALCGQSDWLEWDDAPLLDRTASTHYVLGQTAPFCIAAPPRISQCRREVVFAVWFSPYTCNGGFSRTSGRAQGGAIATILDTVCSAACSASQPLPAPTGTITVRMHRPVAPIPGVFRVSAKVDSSKEAAGSRKVTVLGTLCHGDAPDVALASAEAIHVVAAAARA